MNLYAELKVYWPICLLATLLIGLAYPSNANAQAVQTRQGMQVQFSGSAGKLTRIRLDTNSDGKFDDEMDLIYRMDVGQRLTDTDQAGDSPKLVVSKQTEQGMWFGVLIDSQTALPAFLTWFVPDDQNMVFFRYQAKALRNCGVANVSIAANLGEPLFTGQKYWLPDGKQRQNSDYVNIGYGFWDSYNDYPNDATGCIFVENDVTITYKTLKFVGGKTVYSRFTKGKEIASNNVKGRAGWIRPTFDLSKEVINAGTDLKYEFVFYASQFKDAAQINKTLSSKAFDQLHRIAQTQMDQAADALKNMQSQWASATSGWDYHKHLDQLKLDMVQCQIDLHLVRQALLDAQISGELSGKLKDLSTSHVMMKQIEQAYDQMFDQVQPVNDARSRIGSRFSKHGRVEDALEPLREVHDKARTLQTACRKQINELTNTLAKLGFTIRPELPIQTPGQRRAALLNIPLYSSCWIAPQASVFNSADSYGLDLKKVRALGLQAINTSEHYLYMDSIAQRNKYPQARESAMRALLEPIRDANLKALVGIKSYLRRDRFGAIPSELIGQKMAQSFRGSQTLDYENPEVLAYREDQFAQLSSFLKDHYSDVVVGFDYDNEYAWNQNFSDYAKPNFLAYLKNKHSSIEKLNQAWDSNFASWAELDKQLVMDKKNPLFHENTRDWWMYANEAFTYKHWGSIYRGLKKGWPQAVCIARAPRATIQSTQQFTSGKQITDVIGGHWQKTTEGTAAPILSAISENRPLFHTEFWWTYSIHTPIEKRYDEATVKLFKQQMDQHGYKALCALDGRILFGFGPLIDFILFQAKSSALVSEYGLHVFGGL